MGTEFTPVFVFLIVAIVIAASMIIASSWLAPRKMTRVKQMPYESGMDPIGDARQRFDVRFYLVAIVFLLFDVELLFLYPWAVAQWSADCASGSVAGRSRNPRGIPRLGLLGDHGVHHDPGRGVRLRVAERGLRMAVGSTRRTDVSARAGSPAGPSLAVKPAGALEVPENTFSHARVDAVVNWCRKYSLWPMPFATACCGIELMAVGASRFDIARFGAEVMRFSPRQCDLMIVAGRVAMKMMPCCSGSGCRCPSRSGASAWAPAPPPAGSSIRTPWCRASIGSSRSTSTSPAARPGPSRSCGP